MGMYHSTSGKSGYGYYGSPHARVIPRLVMKQILQREEELRFSQDYHNTISQRDDLKWIREVTLKLQKSVLAEFGYDDAKGLLALHNARGKYLDDPEMNQITVYQRMDRSRKGDLKRGMSLPDVKLSTLDGKIITLHEFINSRKDPNKPIVITAGSIT